MFHFRLVFILMLIFSVGNIWSCAQEAQYSGQASVRKKDKDKDKDADATAEMNDNDDEEEDTEPRGIDLPDEEITPLEKQTNSSDMTIQNSNTGPEDPVYQPEDDEEPTTTETKTVTEETKAVDEPAVPQEESTEEVQEITAEVGSDSGSGSGSGSEEVAINIPTPSTDNPETTLPAAATPTVSELKWHSARYVKAADKEGSYYNVKCKDSEIWMGVKFDDKNDDHIEGIYCGTVDIADRAFEKHYKVAGLEGSSYDVSCDDLNEYLGVGVFYDDKDDDHVEGIYCAPTGVKSTSSRSISLNASKDFKCKETEAIHKIKFDDSNDKSLSRIYCGKMEESDYKVREIKVDTNESSKQHKKCEKHEVLVGVFFDSKGDDHIESILCANTPGINDHTTSNLVQVDNKSGNHYRVDCEGTKAVIGVYYDSKEDDHVEGMHCADVGVNSVNSTRWVTMHDGSIPAELSGLFSATKEPYVCNQHEMIVGITYDDDSDDHVSRIICGGVSKPPYSKRFQNVDNQNGSHYDITCHEDEVVVGFRYDNSDDDHVTGIHCAKMGVSWKGSDTKRVIITNLPGDSYKVACPDGDAIVGIYYDNKKDDHVEGIFCGDTDLYLGSENKKNINVGTGTNINHYCGEKEVVDALWYDDKGDKHVTDMRCTDWYK